MDWGNIISYFCITGLLGEITIMHLLLTLIIDLLITAGLFLILMYYNHDLHESVILPLFFVSVLFFPLIKFIFNVVMQLMALRLI